MSHILHTINISPPQISQSSSSSTQCKLSRRDLAIATSSLPLLLSTSTSSSLAHAADTDSIIAMQSTDTNTSALESVAASVSTDSTTETNATNYCTNPTVTQKAFLDVSIDGKPAGRIIVGLYGEASPIGSARFVKLVSGAAGVTYRRKEFTKITENYIQHGGIRSYGIDAELSGRTGTKLDADNLVSEWENIRGKCQGTANVRGSVGLVVRDPNRPPPKTKLVARGGKLKIEEEEVGKAPNGTEFVITVKDSPDIDDSTLVIGRILDGMDVVEKLTSVNTVKENTSSPYFRIAKLIGDNRAVVAERGFNRPYSKVIVSNCGLME